MKLLMAVSSDGFVAKGPDDDMKWTGKTDKAVFKILTLTGHEAMFVGRKTYELMPKLPGRNVLPLSQTDERCYDLKTANMFHPNAWILGGQTVALEALRKGYLDTVVLCMNGAVLGKGVRLDSRLPNFGRNMGEVKIGDPGDSVSVLVLRK